MTLPTGIKPAITNTVFHAGQKVKYERKIRAWQKAPFDLRLPYFLHTGYYVQDNYDSSTFYGGSDIDAETICYRYVDDFIKDEVNNKSYDKLKNNIYNSAALGVDFAEAHQSFTMIVKSVSTLVSAWKSIKKGFFIEAAREFGRSYVPKGVSKKKSAANNWLEFHFGWQPLIHDIYDAVEVINNPIKSYEPAYGVGKSSDSGTDHVGPGVSHLTKWKCDYVSRQGAYVNAITNSTAHTLDQFGLINPATILWELVPFSFVVDWFANVGQVLASYSDFAGMELKGTYTTSLIRTIANGHTYWESGSPPSTPLLDMTYSGFGVHMQRTQGLTAPVFNVRQLKLPSKTRAVTAISLLVQQLSKK